MIPEDIHDWAASWISMKRHTTVYSPCLAELDAELRRPTHYMLCFMPLSSDSISPLAHDLEGRYANAKSRDPAV